MVGIVSWPERPSDTEEVISPASSRLVFSVHGHVSSVRLRIYIGRLFAGLAKVARVRSLVQSLGLRDC